MSLIPNTATSTDGDPNLYQRELIKSVPVPGLEQPTSIVAEFWNATSQEDGKKKTGFTLALVDDKVMDERTEMPDLNYFKLAPNRSPMMWIDEEYMEDEGIGDDPTREGVDKFLASENYQTLESILLTVKRAAS